MRLIKTVVITPLAPITVYLTVTPTQGHVGVTTFQANVNWDPVSGGPCNITVDWAGQGSETKNQTIPPATFTKIFAAQAVPGTIRATVNDTVTNGSGTTTVTINVRTALTSTFSATPTTGNIPLAVTFTMGIGAGFPNYTWSLSPGDGAAPYGDVRPAEGLWTQLHTYTRAPVAGGSFTATYTVTDALGATVLTASVVVNIVENIKAWWSSLTTTQKILAAGLTALGIAGVYYKVMKRW